MGNSVSSKMLAGPQIIRAVAAILVVLNHISAYLEKFLSAKSDFFDIFHVRGAGIPVFFMLSGYMLYIIHVKDMNQIKRVKYYLLRRIFRIYPIYWIITLALVTTCFPFASCGAPYQHSIASLFKSLLLIPENHAPYLGVAWTLSHEIFYYLMFSFLIINKKMGMWLMAVWGSAILSMIILSPVTPYPLPTQQFPISFLLSPYNLFYVLGLGIAVLQLRYKVRLSSTIFAIGLAMIVLMTFKTDTSSLGALTIIALAGALMLAGSNDIVAKGPLQLLVILGDASYTFYLIQNPILRLLMRLVKRLPASMHPPMHPLGATEIGIGCFIIILIVALIFYKFIEKPLLDLLRRLLQPATVIEPPISCAVAARA